MAVSGAIRLYGHGPTIAAAAAAAVATAAATADLPEKITVKTRSFVSYPAQERLTCTAASPSYDTVPSNLVDVEDRGGHPGAGPGTCSRYYATVSGSSILASSFSAEPLHIPLNLSNSHYFGQCSREALSARYMSSPSLQVAPFAHNGPLADVAWQTSLQGSKAISALRSRVPPAYAIWLPSGLQGQSHRFTSPWSTSTSFNAFTDPSAVTLSNSKALHSWHFPPPGSNHHDEQENRIESDSIAGDDDTVVTVVLLGWLGAKQKHLKKYAGWYTNHGIHALSFVIPMGDLVKPQATFGGRAEEHVDLLVEELERLLDLKPGSPHSSRSSSDRDAGEQAGKEAEGGKRRMLVFHTFSNTGWLCYGAILKKLQDRHGKDTIDQLIRGCVVDSAPVVEPTPQVWASGFSAAILKKRSVAAAMGAGTETKAAMDKTADTEGAFAGKEPPAAPKDEPDAIEKALLSLLEKFFAVFLRLPPVKQKLSELTSVLSSHQPSCPQLYIYSSADKVIPASEVESFMSLQKQSGRVVHAHRMEESPHVDHFRTFPEVYTAQLRKFLEECLPHGGAAEVVAPSAPDAAEPAAVANA